MQHVEVCPPVKSSAYQKSVIWLKFTARKKIFPFRELNPGHLGESQES